MRRHQADAVLLGEASPVLAGEHPLADLSAQVRRVAVGQVGPSEHSPAVTWMVNQAGKRSQRNR